MKTLSEWVEYYFWITLVAVPWVFILIGLCGRWKMYPEPKVRRCEACKQDLHGKVSFPIENMHICLNAKCISAALVMHYDTLSVDEVQRITKRIHSLRCDAVADKFRRWSWPDRRNPPAGGDPVEQDPKWKALVDGTDEEDPNAYLPCDVEPYKGEK